MTIKHWKYMVQFSTAFQMDFLGHPFIFFLFSSGLSQLWLGKRQGTPLTGYLFTPTVILEWTKPHQCLWVGGSDPKKNSTQKGPILMNRGPSFSNSTNKHTTVPPSFLYMCLNLNLPLFPRAVNISRWIFKSLVILMKCRLLWGHHRAGMLKVRPVWRFGNWKTSSGSQC